MARTLQTTVKSGERLMATDITDLTFFPIGTILTFSTEAWSTTSAEFKNIWKICDGKNGTPNLVGKFLRGGVSSDFVNSTGSDTANINLEIKHLPPHSHWSPTSNGQVGSYEVAITGGQGYDYGVQAAPTTETGGGEAYTISTVPSSYTVIYIMKVA